MGEDHYLLLNLIFGELPAMKDTISPLTLIEVLPKSSLLFSYNHQLLQHYWRQCQTSWERTCTFSSPRPSASLHYMTSMMMTPLDFDPNLHSPQHAMLSGWPPLFPLLCSAGSHDRLCIKTVRRMCYIFMYFRGKCYYLTIHSTFKKKNVRDKYLTIEIFLILFI